MRWKITLPLLQVVENFILVLLVSQPEFPHPYVCEV